ncbi:site-specific DNA-methyltransferase [Rhodobacteraceae bacterium 2376]|uniref:site-specific DNA-methyltransferase (adenine-specific) n=1 Tax=Rhabdonatronobacter sediminivivens TaxID=2743469 RepID=A0A7Z0KZM5_9RHOB|nr:site-specific DNA-methyltransferase [Rhabdonatronobacter sediminivivens]NYS26584.1 site-specific DNA-methyltransferase [Rhabdonatronobacter sediminivivens]
MSRKPKLELTWIGKDIRPRLEPRILIEDPELSYHAPARREGDIFDNLLIHGDNLLALKALETDPAVRGKVKCVFIDPPYNTGSAFEHYDDGLEHSLWLGMMRDRLEILRNLLSEDGSIWITIDDNEAHYLKVLCDEVFGRSNFVRHITWQKKYSVSNNYRGIASIIDHVLVYRKSAEFKNNLLPRSDDAASRYSNPDNDPRGPWKAVDYLNQASIKQRPNLVYPIENPFTGELVRNRVKAWKYERETHEKHVEEKRLWWGLRGENSVPALKLFLSEVRDGMTPHNWWPHAEVGHTDESKKEMISIFGPNNVFDTPKPERLIQRIVGLSTNPGDLVLDSFAGSGTTGAVAHKMGRRWIMVELGEHAKTHIVPRLGKVIDGTDKGGVTEATGWKGGGGYRFARLAPSLLEKDAWGNWVIRKEYNPAMLAEAMCKHFGYTFAPSTEHFWMHGASSETSFIYVTTNSLTFEQLRAISDEVGEARSLLVVCAAYESAAERLPNLTLRKIPKEVAGRCEWGKDDYSLKISALPMMREEDEEPAPARPGAAGDLFDDAERT